MRKESPLSLRFPQCIELTRGHAGSQSLCAADRLLPARHNPSALLCVFARRRFLFRRVSGLLKAHLHFREYLAKLLGIPNAAKEITLHVVGRAADEAVVGGRRGASRAAGCRNLSRQVYGVHAATRDRLHWELLQ